MFKKPLLIIVFLLAAGSVLFVFGMALHRAFEPMPVKKTVAVQPDKPDHFNEVSIKLPGRKGCYWDLQVKKTENRSGLGLLQTVNGKYYRGSQMVCQLTSRSGRVNWERGAMTVTGQVELKTADGKHVSADMVAWDPASEQITANGHVRFVEPGAIVNTEQLTTDLNFTKVKTSGNTNTKLIISGKE